MELAELEDLALGVDRPAALAALLPGTVEHDYWRGVFLQHEGRLAESEEILRGWQARHGHLDHHHTKLARRQLLLRAAVDLPASAHELRRETGTSLDDRAEVVVQAQRFPSKLDPAQIDDRAVLRDAARRAANLGEITDVAIPDIVRDPTLMPGFDIVRRPLLQRLKRADIPGVMDMIVEDLNDKHGANGIFGALPIHSLLTLAQLHELEKRLPALRMQGAWVDAVLQRLAPPSWVDIRFDPEELSLLIDRAYAFAETLAPSFNTIKATLLFHRLDLDRARGIYDRARFRAYIELPRNATWVLRDWVSHISNERLVQPQAFAVSFLGIPPIGDDEPLLRDYLSRFLLEEEPAAYSDRLNSDYLSPLMATTRLLAGVIGAEAERCAKILGPSALQALGDRVDIDLAPQNRVMFGADDDVTLEVDVKNVRELEVKVFRINALSYWISKKADVDTSIDLDGMVAGGEAINLSFDVLPIRRARQRIALPQCKRPGTYVVELIGNGRSSRALIRKGALRHLSRTTAAGTVITITDEDGHPLPAARLWLGGRELTPRNAEDGGGITIPFKTSDMDDQALLVHGDVVQRITLSRTTEDAVLRAGFLLTRESLVANQTARVLCRPSLTLGGAPVSLSLLEDSRIDITVTNIGGSKVSRTQPIELGDDVDAVVELNIPDGTTHLDMRLQGRVRIVSRQEMVDVDSHASTELNIVHTTPHTAMLHLARTEGNAFAISLLGKTGEPLAGRAITLTVQHRYINRLLQTTLETDEAGAIHLGAVEGKITRITAAAASNAQRTWDIAKAANPRPPAIHALEGDKIVLSAPAAPRSLSDLCLLEVRGGCNATDVTSRASIVDDTIVIEGLAPGDYRLDDTAITVVPRGPVRSATHASAAAGAWVSAGCALVELREPLPVVRAFEVDRSAGAVVLRLSHATPATRVHFIATRYVPETALRPSMLDEVPVRRPLLNVRGGRSLARYISGRDIGDEYRYVLERRSAPRRPGTMLEKPSLLLNPWALRSTSTVVQTPMVRMAYPASAPMAPAPGAPARRGASMGPPQSQAGPASTDRPGFATVDFLPKGATVIDNVRPDKDGVVRVPLADVGEAQAVRAIVVDPALGAPLQADVSLAAAPAKSRDLRLRLALDPAKHYAEERRIDSAPASTTLVVPDIRTGKIELVDTLRRAHQVLLTLLDDADLREFDFVVGWPSFDDATRRARYSKYACHELDLFLWKKDPAFFASVIRPYLAHKRDKAFVDRFLLQEDLSSFLEPWAFGRLNTVERILLASTLAPVKESLARLVGDAVDLLAPDPEGDAKLVATLLGSASLEAGGGAIAVAAAPAAEAPDLLEQPKQKKTPRKRDEADESEMTRVGGFGGGGIRGLMADKAERDFSEPLYRGAEKTQELAEVRWWKRRIEDINSQLITPNRFWRDLAKHQSSAPFLSPHLGDCNGSFAEAMCALAFLELPFVAQAHTTTLEDTRLTLTLGSHALAAHTSVVELAKREQGTQKATVLIGQSYFRGDDRWEWDGAERRDKYVTGEMIVGVVYRCQVVVTNPTSGQQTLALLLQIPKGAIPVDSGFITRTMSLHIDAYGTESVEYAFYFPLAGRFTHFPAHVTKGSELVAFAEPRELEVVGEPTTVELESWSYVSQHGSLADVALFIEKGNLGRIDLARIAWRMHDPAAFRRITDLLASRHVYDDRLWAYSLMHHDRTRADEWLRHRDELLGEAGVTRLYQHLEYAPLINARAHQLGARRQILNSALDEQYRTFLGQVAHRAKVTADDLLAASHYLLCMDRVEEGMTMLDRVRLEQVTARIQYDYLAAYVACYRGDLAKARGLAAPWVDHAVDRWRNRYAALVEMLDEVEVGASKATVVTDPDNREKRMTEGAARQPSLELYVAGAEITIQYANVASCQLRFFKMDIELLFSRQPFVQGDVERFSFIEPGLTLEVPLSSGDGSVVVPLPLSFRAANLVIEAAATGARKAVTHYAHDLGVQLAHAFGQVRVVRASTGVPLPAVYIKVYGRERGGKVAFYKDGYTDLRGRLDYATLSTDDLDRVERFALLIASDDAGATITEAPPPTR